MKRKNGRNLGVLLVGLLMTALLAFYIYDVAVLKTAPTKNLGRVVLIILALCGTLTKLLTGTGRKGLNVYEQAYKKELGNAFASNPMARKKLLCATRLYNESNYAKALKHLMQLMNEVESVEDRSPVMLFVALCYTDAGMLQDAVRAYQELLKYDLRHAQAHSNLGILYMELGDYESARRHYDAAITYAPENYHAWLNRASLLFRTGELDDATADAHRALEIQNNGKAAAALLAILYALKGDEENKQKYRHQAIVAGEAPGALDSAIAHYAREGEN